MKHRLLKPLAAAACAALLCASLTAPVYAAINPFAQMEAESRRAVETAIAAGTVPAGTTMFDCEFTAANGVTIVIKYKDRNGNWIDVATGQTTAAPNAPPPPAKPAALSEDVLAGYADEVYRLTNEAREQAGLAPLERDAELDAAAVIRAEELSRKFSHTRPDGTGFHTVMGVEENYNYGENGGSSGENPEDQMRGWMESDGHRTNILDLHDMGYTAIGVGAYQDDAGKMYWCQIFYRPL